MEKLLPRYWNAGQDSNSEASTAQSTGQNAINSFDPTAEGQSQRTGMGSSGLGGLLGGETGDYTKQYQDAIANNPTVQSLYQQGNTLYNVPGLAKTANYLQNQVTNAVPDAYSAAKGFDIDSADVQNGVASKLAYLEPQSNAATNNLNTAEGLASNFVNAGIQQNQMNLLPVQAQGQLLTQEEAAQATGWNQANANELDALIAKMQSGVTLSQEEMDRANQLSGQEEAYQAAVDSANIGANAQIKSAQIGNQFKTLSPAQTLVNTFTGQSQRAR